MRFFFLLVFLSVSAVCAYAQTPGQGTNQADLGNQADTKAQAIGDEYDRYASVQGGGTGISSPGGLGTFIETILVLALFIVALYALYRFLQRKRDGGSDAGEAVRVLAHRPFGGNKALEVVEVGRRVFVLGVADSAITLIAEIDDEETLETLRLDYARSGGGTGESFMDRMIRVLGRSKSREQGSISQEKLDYLRAQKERLSAYKKKQ